MTEWLAAHVREHRMLIEAMLWPDQCQRSTKTLLAIVEKLIVENLPFAEAH
jgi:hypothetical protein